MTKYERLKEELVCAQADVKQWSALVKENVKGADKKLAKAKKHLVSIQNKLNKEGR